MQRLSLVRIAAIKRSANNAIFRNYRGLGERVLYSFARLWPRSGSFLGEICFLQSSTATME